MANQDSAVRICVATCALFGTRPLFGREMHPNTGPIDRSGTTRLSIGQETGWLLYFHLRFPLRFYPVHGGFLIHLRIPECGIPEESTNSYPPRGSTRHLGVLLLAAWAIGWFLTTPSAASTQGVCDRTPQVRDELVETTGVSTCEDVTPEHLAAVTLLDLSESGISALQAHDFRGLGRLQRLRLYRNSLAILPSSLFQGLSRLEQLALNSNQLSALPPELFRDQGSLEGLWLYGNRLETLPNGIFSGLSKLTHLSLAENSLTALPADAFAGLSKLESLSLPGNSLSSLPDGAFRDLSSLTGLWLQENSLTTLQEDIFRGMVSLRTLKLDHNLLTGLPEEIFRGLGSLRSLSLDHNLLEHLEGGTFLGLNLLQRLTLDSNSLTRLSEDIFRGLSSLVELQLRQNRLLTLPVGIFKDLRILQILTLDENSVRELPNGVFSGLSRLVQLLLHGNDLRSVPEGVFSPLSGLKRLTLNQNSLRSLPAGVFRQLLLLRDLRLEDNPLASLPEGVFDRNLATLGGVRDGPGLRVDTALKAEPAFLFSDGVAAPGTAATATVTLHRPLPVAVRLPYSLGGTATATDYADLSPNPEEGLLFPAGETRQQISLTIPAGNDRLGRTFVFTLGELSRIRLRRSDGTGPDARFLASETLLSLSSEGTTHTLTVANPDPGSTTGGICDRTPQVKDKLTEISGESVCGQVTAVQLAAVTRLDLRRTGIHLLQAQDFDGLTSLTSLNLQDNPLGTLPQGIFAGLSDLERLEMSGNALSTLPEDVFSGLGSLTWLDLRGNALTALPEGIFSGLGNLETLWLNANSLTELPEGVFRGLGRLADLNLGSNSLTALPRGVFDELSALQLLKLHENFLLELPGGLFLDLSEPEEFIPIDGPSQAARLESLWLQGNRLSALPEDSFQGLGNLRVLLLDGNSLTAVPEGVFRGLARLQVLRLSDNSIASLPQGIFQGMDNLQRLALDHNRLTTLPEIVFHGLSRLTGLNLSGNRLAGLPQGIFQGLTGLEELRLDANRLADLPPGLLDDTLSELGIGPKNQGFYADPTLKARLGFTPAAQTAGPGTRVTVPVTLHRALPVSVRVPFSVDGNATSAEYADLSPSPEEGLMFAAGETRKEITLALLEGAGDAGRTIVLSLGQTSEIELFRSDGTGPKAPFLKAESLLSISAEGFTHTLTVSNLDPGSATGGICNRTPQVRDKLLEATGLRTCGQFTPGRLASVTRLDLRQTEIHALDAQDFNGLSSLKTLSLGENRLTTLPGEAFSGLSGLAWLDLDHNALTALPEGIFRGLGSLETLWLNGNSLAEVPEAVFQDLSRLTDLNLGSNSLTALPEGVFDGLSALQSLKLHENSLVELPGELFLRLSGAEPSPPNDTPLQPAGLESLWLQGNRLGALPRNVFLNLGNLRTLLLDRNSLAAVPEGVFGGLSLLQTLRLNHNSIASLPPGIFRGLSSLEELRLDGNRMEALPPGILDDALATLGTGPDNQGLFLDANLKARLGFGRAAQTADSGTMVTASVTLHQALPVSLRVPFSVGGTASSTDYANLSPSPDEGLLFAAGETRKEVTLDLLESAGAGKTIQFTLGDLSEFRLGPSDGTGPDAPFLKAETLVSGSPDPETHTVTVTGPGAVRLNRSLVPVILSRAGRSGSFFTSEMTLTNRGAAEAALTYTYTAHQGGGSGTANNVLAAGRQKIVPDAIDYLRGLGVPIPADGNPIGTLGVEFAGDSTVGLSVRTTTPVPRGRAGLAYSGVSREEGFQEPVYLAGLRQTAQDRSNLAIQNMGTAAEGPIRLRVTVFSGDAGDSNSIVFDGIRVEPGGFRQFDEVLGGLANGYARVEKTAGAAPFYAYGVINDQANSDGSFILPVTAASLAGTTGQTLPVILERGPFTSELTVTNFSDQTRTVRFAFVAEGVDAPDRTAEFSMDVQAGQQVITPDIVEEMRREGVAGIGPSGGLAGALFAWVESGDMSGIVIGARTLTPALVAGGRYGVFYNAVAYGSAFSRVAWVEGLQQNQESRTNLALINTGEIDDSESVFSIDIFDGDTGLPVRTITGRTVPARGWRQIDSILRDYAAGTTQGYVRIRKISGNNPFLAYGVINDGGSPGERSGDGAFLAARE